MNDAVDAYWLEQTEGDVPVEDHWLSAREILCLGGLRFAKRRADWRLGRWTAKRALASYLNLPSDPHFLEDLEIQAAPSGAPEVFLFKERAAVTISLSHRAGTALCVVGLSGTILGCDLETVEKRGDRFVADFFTANEQTLIERTLVRERPLLVTLLWSAKESALKALHVGLRLDTASIDVSPADPAQRTEDLGQNPFAVSRPAPAPACWSPLRVRHAGAHVLFGWWRHADHLVRTVVLNPLR